MKKHFNVLTVYAHGKTYSFDGKIVSQYRYCKVIFNGNDSVKLLLWNNETDGRLLTVGCFQHIVKELNTPEGQKILIDNIKNLNQRGN